MLTHFSFACQPQAQGNMSSSKRKKTHYADIKNSIDSCDDLDRCKRIQRNVEIMLTKVQKKVAVLEKKDALSYEGEDAVYCEKCCATMNPREDKYAGSCVCCNAEEKLCIDCLVKCSRCGENLCSGCAEECGICMDAICKFSCVVECELCNTKVCSETCTREWEEGTCCQNCGDCLPDPMEEHFEYDP